MKSRILKICKSNKITISFIVGSISCGFLLMIILGLQMWSNPFQFHCNVGNYRDFQVYTNIPSSPIYILNIEIKEINQTGVFGDLTKKFLNNSEITQTNIQFSLDLNINPSNEEDFITFKTFFYRPNWQIIQNYINPIDYRSRIIIDSLEFTNFGLLYLKKFSMTIQINDIIEQKANYIELTYFYDFDGRLVRLENLTKTYNSSIPLVSSNVEPLEVSYLKYELIRSDIPIRLVISIYPFYFYLWMVSVSPIIILIPLMRRKKGIGRR
ncbi:MAG: hypothetical protein ACTSRB_14990 [Candidatus Helarchaeota archaeon]